MHPGYGLLILEHGHLLDELIIAHFRQFVDVYASRIIGPHKHVILNPIHNNIPHIPGIRQCQTGQYLQLGPLIILVHINIALPQRNIHPAVFRFPNQTGDLRVHFHWVNEHTVFGIRDVEEPINRCTVQYHVYFVEVDAGDCVVVDFWCADVLVVRVWDSLDQFEYLYWAIGQPHNHRLCVGEE